MEDKTKRDPDEQIHQILELCRDFGITEVYLPQTQSAATATVSSSKQEELDKLRHAEIGTCTRCKLHKGRKTIVFGEGNPEAPLMLIGEAPGADEDDQGRPFVGRAGQLLMQMIKAINYERKDVYIANILKCRPPGNRPPEQDEVKTCSPFLWKQIAIIQPKLILALGTYAAQTIIGTTSSISMLRSRVYEFPFGRVLATYHPSYLLRSPNKKPEAWEDLKLARKILTES